MLAAFGGLCNYFAAILPLGGLEQRGAALTTTIGLFLTELTLFAIALFISGLSCSYKGAVRLGAGVLLAFYGISVLSEYLEAPALCCLTPLKYFDVYKVATGGLHPPFLLLSVVIMTSSAAVAQKAWAVKEI